MSKEWLELARKNADMRRRIDKLNVRRAEVAANVEMTLARCAELEAENAELKSHLHGRREEIQYLRSELSAWQYLRDWVMANPSRCVGNSCGEIAAFTMYDQELITIDATGPTVVELAEKLGWEAAK
jgi:predicted RNase H-like nuclease (RuvC/YqgF family)